MQSLNEKEMTDTFRNYMKARRSKNNVRESNAYNSLHEQ